MLFNKLCHIYIEHQSQENYEFCAFLISITNKHCKKHNRKDNADFLHKNMQNHVCNSLQYKYIGMNVFAPSVDMLCPSFIGFLLLIQFL